MPRASAGVACPRGSSYATIRHSLVKAGKWAQFEKAVADHTAWYAAKGSRTVTRIVRVVEIKGGKPGLSTMSAMTITKYAGAAPERDAGYAAFTAEYKDSATIKDEARVCLPTL